MAYGNLPGGGFSGYIKAEQPLVIEKPSSPPISKWPEKDESLKDTSKDRLRKFWKRKRLEKVDKKSKVDTADDQNQEFKDAFTQKVDEGLEDFKTGSEDEISDDMLAEDPEIITRQKDDELSEGIHDREPKKKSRDHFRGILKRKDKDKARKAVTGRRRSVTFDDKDLERYEPKEDIGHDEAKEDEQQEGEERIEIFDDKRKKSKLKRKKKLSSIKEDLEERIEIPEEEEITRAKDDFTIDFEDLEDSLFQPVKDEDSSDDELPEVPDTSEPEFRVKFLRPRRTPTYTYLKRKRSITRFSPCVDRLLYSKRVEYRGLKAMLGFPIGALFGFALYWIVLYRIGAEHYYCWLLGTIVGSGFALSTQVRCICFLSLPSSCGRAGRAFVSTYTVAYLLEGPLANVLNNSREAMRSISCTASLNLNHSVERFKLMFKPVKEIVVDFVKSGQKVQDDTKRLENAFGDIEKEVRDEDELKESIADTKQVDEEIGGESRVDLIKKKFGGIRKKTEFGEESEKKYGMKSEFRCEGVFNKGVRACYDSFEKAYDRCHSYLPIIGYLLCWPMKLTFICDLASSIIGKRACDSADALNPGFGASVDTADGVQSEFDKDFAVQLQYKLTIPDQKVDQLTPEDVTGAMKYSFERRKRNLEFFAKVVDRILAILCLLVINSSRKYCNRYLRVIQFDNKYITSYFRHIDARRHRDGKLTLLPLKKGEKVELSDPFSVKLSAEEKMKMIVSGLRLVSEVLTVSILLVFDRFFYEFLDLVKRHAHVTYKQTGVHHIKMTVYGDGFVANMVRGILKGFDKKHTTDQVTTTEECLPLPTKLPQEIIIRLYLVFLVMLVLIIVESYASRLRRVMCAFFYPKREKKRIIFLYNDRLKKRRSFLKYMKHQVRKQAREQAVQIDSGVFFTLRKFYPKYFNWVSKFGLGLERCLVCGETESRKCRLTSCSGCPFSYCAECWQDTEGKCYVCIPDDDTEPSDDSTSEDE